MVMLRSSSILCSSRVKLNGLKDPAFTVSENLKVMISVDKFRSNDSSSGGVSSSVNTFTRIATVGKFMLLKASLIVYMLNVR